MKRIEIDVIDHQDQLYDTCGNFYYDGDGVLRIEVSDLGDEDMEFLVSLHEFVEEHLTRKFGISEKVITEFDLMFEEERKQGLHTDDEEPGFDNRSPYREFHAFSEKIERLVADKLDVGWAEYSKRIMSLSKDDIKIEEIKAGEGHLLHRIDKGGNGGC